MLEKEIELKGKEIALLRTKAITYQIQNLLPSIMDHEIIVDDKNTDCELRQQIKELKEIRVRKDKELRSQSKKLNRKSIPKNTKI
jgi:hypothetical protein